MIILFKAYTLCILLFVLQTSFAQDGGFWWKIINGKHLLQQGKNLNRGNDQRENSSIVYGGNENNEEDTGTISWVFPTKRIEPHDIKQHDIELKSSESEGGNREDPRTITWNTPKDQNKIWYFGPYLPEQNEEHLYVNNNDNNNGRHDNNKMKMYDDHSWALLRDVFEWNSPKWSLNDKNLDKFSSVEENKWIKTRVNGTDNEPIMKNEAHLTTVPRESILEEYEWTPFASELSNIFRVNGIDHEPTIKNETDLTTVPRESISEEYEWTPFASELIDIFSVSNGTKTESDRHTTNINYKNTESENNGELVQRNKEILGKINSDENKRNSSEGEGSSKFNISSIGSINNTFDYDAILFPDDENLNYINEIQYEEHDEKLLSEHNKTLILNYNYEENLEKNVDQFSQYQKLVGKAVDDTIRVSNSNEGNNKDYSLNGVDDLIPNKNVRFVEPSYNISFFNTKKRKIVTRSAPQYSPASNYDIADIMLNTQMENINFQLSGHISGKPHVNINNPIIIEPDNPGDDPLIKHFIYHRYGSARPSVSSRVPTYSATTINLGKPISVYDAMSSVSSASIHNTGNTGPKEYGHGHEYLKINPPLNIPTRIHSVSNSESSDRQSNHPHRNQPHHSHTLRYHTHYKHHRPQNSQHGRRKYDVTPTTPKPFVTTHTSSLDISKSIETFGILKTLMDIGKAYIDLKIKLNKSNNESVNQNSHHNPQNIDQPSVSHPIEQPVYGNKVTTTEASKLKTKSTTEIIPSSSQNTLYNNQDMKPPELIDSSEYIDILTPEENNTHTSEDGCICVYYFLCQDGTVNTNGMGLIDLRFSSCPNDNEVCCKLLKNTANTTIISNDEETPTDKHNDSKNEEKGALNPEIVLNQTMYDLIDDIWPKENLYKNTMTSSTTMSPESDDCVCVPYFLCADGVINVHGEGVLDLRSQISSCSDESEVCCKLPITTTPFYHDDGKNNNKTEEIAKEIENLWSEIEKVENFEDLEVGSTGAEESGCLCVYYFLCEDGSVNIDGKGLIDLRFSGCPEDQICCKLVKNGTESFNNETREITTQKNVIRDITTKKNEVPEITTKKVNTPTIKRKIIFLPRIEEPIIVERKRSNETELGQQNEEKNKDNNEEEDCECVYYFLCAEGIINTDGKGIIDLRFNVCPEDNQVCCKKLRKTQSTTETKNSSKVG